MVKAMLQPAPAMLSGQEVPALLADQALERLCLDPDGLLVYKPAFLDLLQASISLSLDEHLDSFFEF